MKQGAKACLGGACLCACVLGHKLRAGEEGLETLVGRTAQAVGRSSRRGRGSGEPEKNEAAALWAWEAVFGYNWKEGLRGNSRARRAYSPGRHGYLVHFPISIHMPC